MNRWQTGAFLLAAALVIVLGGSTRADNLDEELSKQAPVLLEQLQKQGCKNVGVCKFMVKKGKGELTFNAGSLNTNLATRLENALILVADASKPIGIIRDATGIAAAQAPKATYRTQPGREQLLKLSYPLAWGTQKVSPDALLSGTVELSANMRETTVNLVLFDKKSAKLQDFMTFKVKTDRSILADSGQSFVVNARSLRTARGVDDLDMEAVDSAETLDQQNNGSNSTTPPSTLTGLLATHVKLDIRYDSAPQIVTQDPASGGEYKVSDPKEGQKVEFALTNLTDRRLGVVLKVNGKSTFREQEEEDDLCHLWVLEPRATHTIRGFYDDTANHVDLFKVLSDEESRSAWANYKKPGFIDLAVFEDAGSNPIGNELVVSHRGLSHKAQAKAGKPTTLATAKSQLQSNLKTTRGVKRGLITGGGGTESVTVKSVDFAKAQLAGNAHIQYYVLPSP